MLVLIVTASLTQALAQKCKPKVSEVDGFTDIKLKVVELLFTLLLAMGATMNSKNITNENI